MFDVICRDFSGFGYAHSISMHINIALFTLKGYLLASKTILVDGGFEPLPFDSATAWDNGEDMKETQIKPSMVTIYRHHHTTTNQACHKNNTKPTGLEVVVYGLSRPMYLSIHIMSVCC